MENALGRKLGRSLIAPHRRDRYIGLCYGPPGVGKTLSAIYHSRIQKIVPLDRWNAEASDAKPIDTVLFTPEVVNTPARIENDVKGTRAILCSVVKRATYAEQRATLDVLRNRDEAWRVEHREDRDYRPNQPLPLKPTYYDTLHEYEARLEAIPDPTTLIVVDEADKIVGIFLPAPPFATGPIAPVATDAAARSEERPVYSAHALSSRVKS